MEPCAVMTDQSASGGVLYRSRAVDPKKGDQDHEGSKRLLLLLIWILFQPINCAILGK